MCVYVYIYVYIYMNSEVYSFHFLYAFMHLDTSVVSTSSLFYVMLQCPWGCRYLFEIVHLHVYSAVIVGSYGSSILGTSILFFIVAGPIYISNNSM